jgi:UDPglucose--hexose-1-phosphate uridylyltransferase
MRELERGDTFAEPGERLVATAPGWRAWVPEAPIFPYALVLVPEAPVPDLPSLHDAGRDGLATLLVDVLERLDRVFDAQTPYMLWIHQRPFDGGDWPLARLHVEIASPWRAPEVARYIAAGELGSGVYFNPVAPEEAAQTLRDAVRAGAESFVDDAAR